MHIRMPDVHVGVKTGCIIYTDHEMFLHFNIQYIILARNLVCFVVVCFMIVIRLSQCLLVLQHINAT